MTKPLDVILAHVDANRDAALESLRVLIRAQEIGESEVQRRVEAAAREIGCATETIDYAPGDVPMIAEFAADAASDPGRRRSVMARYRGAGGGRSVIFFAHPDSEPVADTASWRHDSFAGVIDGGKIYGWGVADDLAGVAILTQGLRAVILSGFRPAGDVILASTPSKRHARGVSALLHGGLTADAAVYLHPAESGAGMREIKAFASGQVEFRIIVEGRAPDTNEPSHTAFSHLAINPIDKAWIIYHALQDLGAARAATIHHPRLDERVGRSTNLLLSHIACGDPQRTSRLGLSCVIGGALSFPPPEKLSDIQAQIEDAVRAASESDSWLSARPPRILWDAGVSGAEVEASHPLYQAVAEAVIAVTGEEPHVNPMHTSSDIRNPIVQKGIPTVGLGPLAGDLTQNGRVDEWVDVEDYVRAIKVAAAVIVNWCGVARSAS